MDAARREELKKRRAEMKSRQEEADHRKVTGNIVPQLRSRGVPHRMLKRGEIPPWLPPYLPSTWSRIFWEGAAEPAEWEYCESLAERVAVVGRMLSDRTVPGDDLLFVYDGISDPIMLRQEHTFGVLEILLEPIYTIWITSPPADWLIEAHNYTVRLALPPPVPPEEAALSEARRAALVAPLTDALDADGITYKTYSPTDLAAPEPPTSIAVAGGVKWQRLEITFRACVPRHDISALAKELGGFLDTRCGDETLVAVRLLHADAPIITLTVGDLVRFIGHAMAAGDRWDEHAPGGEIWVSGLHVYPVEGDWLAEVYVERANWRLRVAG